MGAIMGAACACPDEFEEMIRLFKTQVRGMLNDYTLPFVSLARGRRFDRCLRALFGDANIEDLWTPYFCVTSNLTRAKMVVHRTGPVWRLVRASGSLPGIVSPVVDNGDLLYDGCLMNNLPLDVMREEIQTGLLIGVDVVPPEDLDIRAADLESPSGWRMVWNRINPLADPMEMPGIVSILDRAGTLSSIRDRQQLIEDGFADLYLSPPVDQFKILDWDIIDKATEIGYAYGVAEIGAWKKSKPRDHPVSRALQ